MAQNVEQILGDICKCSSVRLVRISAYFRTTM